MGVMAQGCSQDGLEGPAKPVPKAKQHQGLPNAQNNILFLPRGDGLEGRAGSGRARALAVELGVHRGPHGASLAGRAALRPWKRLSRWEEAKWQPLWASAPGQVPLQAAPGPREGRLLRPLGELCSGPDSSCQALD